MNSKQKGKRGELELSQKLRSHGYDQARRGVQYRGDKTAPDVVGVPGLHLECKRVEALRTYSAVEQAVRDCGPGDIPVVAYRANDQPWLAILTLDDFLLIWRELDGLRNSRAAPAALSAGSGLGDSPSKRMASAERW